MNCEVVVNGESLRGGPWSLGEAFDEAHRELVELWEAADLHSRVRVCDGDTRRFYELLAAEVDLVVVEVAAVTAFFHDGWFDHLSALEEGGELASALVERVGAGEPVTWSFPQRGQGRSEIMISKLINLMDELAEAEDDEQWH